MIRPVIKLATVAIAVATLGGCALLKSPDPIQTFRFGGTAPTTPAAVPTSATQVSLRRIDFPAAVAADRILGVTGTQTAYISGGRWVSPASTLFTDALTNAFVAQSSRVRIIGRRELTPSTRALDIDVRTFEARYDTPGAAPTVVITARARMMRTQERTVAAEQTFSVSQPASANRVSAIVEAFDLANRDLTTQIVSWTDGVATLP